MPELNAVYRSLLLEATMRGNPAAVQESRPFFPPDFDPGGATTEIYYLPIYPQLLGRMNAVLQKIKDARRVQK